MPLSIIICADSLDSNLPIFVTTCHDGKMMLENILESYLDNYSIYITILSENDERFKITKRLRYIFQNRINITVLDAPTSSLSETVYNTIKRNNITGAVLIRDCNSFFEHEVSDSDNKIYFTCQPDHKNLCYQFNSANEFCKAFEALSSTLENNSITTVANTVFNTANTHLQCEVINYVDVSSQELFDKYNDKPTYFSDIDGVICKPQSRYDETPFIGYVPVVENVKTLLAEQERGCKIIFTTARDSKFVNETNTMLTELGFKNYRLIMDVTRSKRVIINDYERLYPTCAAICIKSGKPELKKFIGVNDEAKDKWKFQNEEAV